MVTKNKWIIVWLIHYRQPFL